MAVIGGGLAGIAAAEAAARYGYQVDLFEWSRVLGGRNASMHEPLSGDWIDNGQHIVLGCCRRLIALHERLDLSGFFDRYETVSFAAPNGKRWEMITAPYLPARWQLVPAFLKMPFLTFTDRLATGLMLRKLGKLRPKVGIHDILFLDWLKKEGASQAAVTTFWSPLILSTLSDTVEHVSLAAVHKVVCDGFLAGSGAMTAMIPNRPLRDIYGGAACDALHRLGVNIRTQTRIARLLWENYADEACTRAARDDDEAVMCQLTGIESGSGEAFTYDRYVLAIPSYRARKLLETSGLESLAEMLDLARFEPGAITSVHLWCAQRILPEHQTYCAVLDGPGQVLFCPKRNEKNTARGVYHIVVISASHRLLSEAEMTDRGNAELVSRVMNQLAAVFPGEHQVLNWRVTTVFDAVFSPGPGVFSGRPHQETPLANLALAGDWTETGWPSTMEGAVISGERAAGLWPDDWTDK